MADGVDIGEFKCDITGSAYIGQFKGDLMHGLGVIKETGHTYAGTWYDGSRSGYGECMYSNGSVYRGQWKGGSFHGYGEYIHTNGEMYLGEFDESLRHGMGRCISKTGSLFRTTKIEDSIWCKNKSTGVTCDASFIVEVEKGKMRLGLLFSFPHNNRL